MDTQGERAVATTGEEVEVPEVPVLEVIKVEEAVLEEEVTMGVVPASGRRLMIQWIPL